MFSNIELLPVAAQHLQEMKKLANRNERIEKLKTMHFWQAAKIALAIRKVLIQYPDEVLSKVNKPIIFLIGGTGAGKSTTLCFLRKDKITQNDVRYESLTNDSIIGHDNSTSKTFLANFFELEDCIICDFAGFEDTHGYFVALGVELALKSLLRRYSSKVMVVESITNNQGRYHAAAQLGTRLNRILNDPKKCILGITKYIQDPHFIKIRTMEEIQQKEILDPIKKEVTILNIQINFLEDLKQPQLFPQIEALKLKLEESKQQLEKKQREKLPATAEKNACRQKIIEKENELCNQIGIPEFIALDTLKDNEELLNSCLKRLKNLPIVTINPENKLDSEHQKLLEDIFENDYLDSLNQPNAEQEEITYENFDSLKQAITDGGLIYAVLDKDISTLFRLPEMSISLYQDFNEKLIKTCTEKYIKEILSLNLTQMYKKINHPMLKAEIKALKMMLKKYLFEANNELEEENERQFIKVEQIYCGSEKSINERFRLPYWIKYLAYFNTQKPMTLLTFKNGIPVSEPEIAKAIEEIRIIQEQLKALKDIEHVVLTKKIQPKKNQKKVKDLVAVSPDFIEKKDEPTIPLILKPEPILIKKEYLENEIHPAPISQINFAWEPSQIVMEHLKKMEKLRDYRHQIDIDNFYTTSFSETSQIVLATKEVLVRYVNTAIPNTFAALPLVFLVGESGVGISTTFCFLRGDTMKKVENATTLAYDSIYDNPIGHDSNTSKTFFPKIAILDDCILVDFPGFNNAHGQFVSLGIELALKELISQHQSKVVILESLTRSERNDLFSNVALNNLERILTDHKDCLLGITKYLEYVPANNTNLIETILEERSQNDVAVNLSYLINTFENINQSGQFSSKIEELKQKLEDIKQEEQRSIERKNFAKNRIHEKELKLKNQFGTANFIAFNKLEDNKELLQSCLDSIKKLPIIKINPKYKLSIKHTVLLEYIFKNDFMNYMTQPHANQIPISYKNFKSFRQAIKEVGLINAILAKDISLLFHVPDMDHTAYRHLNKNLIKKCLENYIDEILSLNLTEMLYVKDSMLKKEIIALKNTLRQYLFEEKENAGSKKIQMNEYSFREREIDNYSKSTKPIEERCQLPFWIKYLSYINLKQPKTLLSCQKPAAPYVSPCVIFNSAFEVAQAIEEIKAIHEQMKALIEIKDVVYDREIKLAHNDENNVVRGLNFFVPKTVESQQGKQHSTIQSSSLNKQPIEISISNEEIYIDNKNVKPDASGKVHSASLTIDTNVNKPLLSGHVEKSIIVNQSNTGMNLYRKIAAKVTKEVPKSKSSDPKPKK